jgi:hypothetical protein
MERIDELHPTEIDDLNAVTIWSTHMKQPINSRLLVSLSLLSIVAAGAVPAAETLGSAQEQARLLLSGNSFPAGDARPRLAVLRLDASNPPAADAQEQARQMIVGRPAVEADTHSSRATDISRGREAGGDPLDLARRMILATPSKVNPPIPRLARKAE